MEDLERQREELSALNKQLQHEITERKQAEKALQDSEDRFTKLAEQSPNMIFVNQKGKVVYANSICQTFTGYTREEFYSPDFNFLSLIAPESRDLVKANLNRHMKNEDVPPYEFTLLNKDGKKSDVILTTTLMEYEGSVAILGVLTDITKRRQAEDALRESEQRYRTLFESAAEGILIADIETKKFKYANPAICTMLGYGQEELTKMGVSDIHPKTSLEHVVAEFAAQARGEKILSSGLPCLKKDGTIIYADINTAKAIIDGRECNIGLFTDITKRRRAERELQERMKELREKNEQLDAQNEELQSQSEELTAQQQELMDKTKELEEANVHLQKVDRLKSVFLASMSHELRTPLNSIIGFTDLILQGMVGEINEEQRSQLTLVSSSANHLLSLINDLLDISKIEAGKVELELEEFRLGDVATEVVETFSPTAKLKGIRLLTDISEDTTLFSDKRRLKQVLMNLVSNAVKFTDRGSVKVTSGIPADDNLEISVIDTGIGIKKEDIGKLFVPFQQVDESLTKKHTGTGLGLYISRKILTLLGGDISVESKYGVGSEFTFTLPVHYVKEQRNAQSISSG